MILKRMKKVTQQRKTEYLILGFHTSCSAFRVFIHFKPIKNRRRLIAKSYFHQKKALKLAYDTEIISEIKENSQN